MVNLKEFQLMLQVMLGVYREMVIFTITLDQNGKEFQVLLPISVLVLIMMFGLLMTLLKFFT